MAGQIAELAHRTLVGAYRNIDTREAQIVLLDAAPVVLPPFEERLSHHAAAALTDLGVHVKLSCVVTDVDADGLRIRDANGHDYRIESSCKIWSAGVAASPSGARLVAQSSAELDRSGRVEVNDDLSLPGHQNVYIIGDMASLNGLPGVAQVAIQGGRHAARQIAEGLSSAKATANCRRPSYIDITARWRQLLAGCRGESWSDPLYWRHRLADVARRPRRLRGWVS
jgi:NADH dehydrogenase